MIRDILIPLGIYLSFLGFCEADFCTVIYKCEGMCSRLVKHSNDCGWLNQRRCTSYFHRDEPCTKDCYRNDCCVGYTGSGCTIPLCSGKTACDNGGTCIAPNRCSCLPGFTGVSTCIDIDECEENNAGCAQSCVNEIGSYKCVCNEGYTMSWDQTTCDDVDECAINNGDCADTCVNDEGSYYCKCDEGYKLNTDSKTCFDQDECQLNTSKCEHLCSNTVGSYTCSCKKGYRLASDGFTCEDKNECELDRGICEQVCVNDIGSYHCTCGEGYIVGQEGLSCNDVNECLIETDRCTESCTNSVGSYTCSCKDGFALASDGWACTEGPVCTLGMLIIVNRGEVENLGTDVIRSVVYADNLPSLQGKLTPYWAGQDGLKILSYGGRKLNLFYAEIGIRIQKPEQLGSKQIIMSNCMRTTGNTRLPTLELSLIDFTEDGGYINLQARSQDTVEMKIPFKTFVETWHKIKIMYNGTHIGVLVYVLNTELSVFEIESKDFASLTGPVPIHNGGLHFMKCGNLKTNAYYRNDNVGQVTNFIGGVQDIQFSTCLTADMETDLELANTEMSKWPIAKKTIGRNDIQKAWN